MRKACDFISKGYDTILPHHGHAVNRVIIAAKAFGTCGLVLHDESLVEKARQLMAYAVGRRDGEGVFEKGGRDSSYNAVSILFGLKCWLCICRCPSSRRLCRRPCAGRLLASATPARSK